MDTASGSARHQGKRQPEGAPLRALCDLASRQQRDGAWEGEVVWCTMITAQMVIARAILGCSSETAWRDGVRTYLARQQNPDGGWGLHPLSSSRLFTTTLACVALRLLVRGEVAATAAQCLSPVNGVLNLLALWAENPADPTVARLLRGLEAWRWRDEGGIRYAGARSIRTGRNSTADGASAMAPIAGR